MMNGVSLMETNHLVSISLRALLSIHQALHVSRGLFVTTVFSAFTLLVGRTLLAAQVVQFAPSKILIKTPAFALLLKTSVRSQRS